MSKCLSSSNCILKLISHFAISNPMSAAGRNYRSLIDDHHYGKCGNSRSVMRWKKSCKAIEHTVTTIRELIIIIDGHKECIGFSFQELDVSMLDLYVLDSLFFYLFFTVLLCNINYYLCHFNNFNCISMCEY